MNSQLGELPLAAAFPPADLDQWRRLALGVVRKSGKANDDTPPEAVDDLLAKTTYDGIKIPALYTAPSAAPAIGLPGTAPFVRGSRPLGAVTAGWDVRQCHADPDPAVSRAEILADLEHGVTSLWLILGEAGIPVSDLTSVLDGVHLDLAGVVLDAGGDTPRAAEALLDLISNGHTPPDRVNANLGADPVGTRIATGDPLDLTVLTDLAVRVSSPFPGIRAGMVDATCYHDAGGSDVQELGCSIATGLAYLRALTAAGMTPEAAFGQLEFRYAATVDQFLTIAKFRAARRLWARVADVIGVAGAGAQRQHAVTSSAMMTLRDPWVNMLRTTVACFAAAVGGADAISVAPFDACIGLPDSSSRRIARNTQALLLDESNLGKVIDPAGGSWYVEQLTDDMAKAAWSWFVEIERAGGIVEAIDSGLITSKIDETWAKRSKRVARRSHPLTGVSEFPNLTEQLPVRQQVARNDTARILPRRRYSQAFEAIRDLSDAQDSRPSVFLATIGSVAAHTTRATFASNLFAAGGIATVTSGAGTDAAEIAQRFADSGLTIACLCSTDKLYEERAEEVAAALRSAGARKIWLAGPPKEYAGVDAYLFAGCNTVDVLQTTLADLDVKAAS